MAPHDNAERHVPMLYDFPFPDSELPPHFAH
jgi:hypothetical protein